MKYTEPVVCGRAQGGAVIKGGASSVPKSPGGGAALEKNVWGVNLVAYHYRDFAATCQSVA